MHHRLANVLGREKHNALENLQFYSTLNKDLPASFAILGQETWFLCVKVIRRGNCEPICIDKYLQYEKNCTFE